MKIGDIADVVRGSSPRPQGDPRYYGGPVPRLMVADLTRDGKNVTPRIDSLTLQGSELSRPMEKGDMVIAVSGNPGLPAILAIDACIHDGFVGLRNLDTSKVNIEYLYRFLLYEKSRTGGQAVGAIFKNLTSDQVREIDLPLPPLPEQKRIASILDKADSIRRKRQEAVRLTEELLRSVFLEMFGDPVANPKGWTEVTIRDLVTEVKYGTSDKASYEGKYPVLRMNNITYLGGWNFTDLKRIDIPEKELSKYLVRKGDILFNRTNSKELVGKTAVYRRDDPMAYAGYLIRIRPNKQNNSEYIAAYLNSTHGKTILESMCKSIVGMANINAQELQEIAIMQPPLELQDQYAALVHSVGRAKEKLITSSEVTDTLFDSLLQRAFKGEL